MAYDLKRDVIERHYDELQKHVSVTAQKHKDLESSLQHNAEKILDLSLNLELSEEDRKALIDIAVSIKETKEMIHELAPTKEEIEQEQQESNAREEIMRQMADHEEKFSNVEDEGLCAKIRECASKMQANGCEFEEEITMSDANFAKQDCCFNTQKINNHKAME